LEFEDGLIKLQEFVKSRPIILAGSGLSISMGIPGMGKLLEHLTLTLPQKLNENYIFEWDECLKIIKEKGFEQGLLEKKVSGELLINIINETALLIETYDGVVFGKLNTMTINDYPFAKLLNHLVISLPPTKATVDVITTNYDHLVEYACDLIEIECCTGFKGTNIQFFKLNHLKEHLFKRVATTQKNKKGYDHRVVPRVRLLKPHGSLKWQRNGNKTFQANNIMTGSERVIITPGSTKFEVSLTDYVMNAHRELANECLNSTESVIIVGYGFNDNHLQTVLTERLKSGLNCLILTHGLTPNAKKLIHECKQIIALEAFSELKTKWYFNGLEGVWEEPLWDLGHFVKRVI
jgi:hypothetical protein